MAGMNGALQALEGSLETASITFGMAFPPVFEQADDVISEPVIVFIGLPKPVRTVISFVTGGAVAFLTVGAAMGFVVGSRGAPRRRRAAGVPP
jgi:hypothetical protein